MIQTLMLIDDDEDDREMFLSIVESSHPGISWSIARNGREALKELENASTHPDVIFLDLNMPLMDGRQFMQVVRSHEKLQQIPIVILTTSSDSKTMLDMKALGAKHFFTKPDKYAVWKQMLHDFFINPRL